MKLINGDELLSNLKIEFEDDNNEITQYWLNKLREEVTGCQEYTCERCDSNSKHNMIFQDEYDWYIQFPDDDSNNRKYINYCPYCGRYLYKGEW